MPRYAPEPKVSSKKPIRQNPTMRRQAAIDEGCPNNMREDNARAGTRPKVTGIDVPKAFTR
jgi:hypothetical protein